jgi:phosphoribosylamine-glycine ligase
MYRSDRQITEALLPVRMLSSVVHFGAVDRQDPEAQQVLAWLKAAELDLLDGRADRERVKIARRSWSAYDRAIKPYLDSETACAKFGLIVFYLLAELEAQEIYLFEPSSAFDQAQRAIYSEEGSIVEIAGTDAIDSSAQKQARRLLRQLQEDGFFREAIAT